MTCKSGWRGLAGAAMLGLALGGAAWADDHAAADASEQPSKYDDTGRLYLTFDTGMNFTLDRHFAGDVKIDPGEGAGMDYILGGDVGYNITRNWGVELQFQGTEPDLRSSSRGKIHELSVITVVPTARYRWHLLEDRLVPYVTGGVGMSFNDTNEESKPAVTASPDSTPIGGSLSAGLDYFLSEDVSVGVDARYLIHPNQDASVSFRNPNTFRTTHFDSTTNLTSISLLAHIRIYLGQQADADGGERHS